MNEVQLELDLVIADKYERRRAALKSKGLHYSDRIVEALKARGWIHNKSGGIGSGKVLYKEVELADKYVGEMGIKRRVIAIGIDDDLRYFSVLSGFHDVFDIDGRDFDFKPKAGAKLLDEYVEKMYS